MSLKRLLFLLIFFNAFALGALISGVREKSLSFDFLSVGQGDSELISLPGDVKIMIDGGPDSSVLAELEKSLGRRKRIDVMVLTHPHADHYVGLAETIKRYETGVILLPDAENYDPAFIEFLRLAESEDIPVLKMGSGDRIKCASATIKILSPSFGGDLKDANSRSITALFEGFGIKALFTGDIGIKQEKEIMDRYDIDADILKVPHHGSNGSSSYEFIEEISPAVSVIEAGIKNRYGFPRNEVLARLRSAGSVIYRTDRDGSIRVTVSGKGLKVFKLGPVSP